MASIDGIIFLGQKSNIVAQVQKSFEKTSGLDHPVLKNLIVRQPETARDKYALSGREPVSSFGRVISPDEAIAHQVVLYRREGSSNT